MSRQSHVRQHGSERHTVYPPSHIGVQWGSTERFGTTTLWLFGGWSRPYIVAYLCVAVAGQPVVVNRRFSSNGRKTCNISLPRTGLTHRTEPQLSYRCLHTPWSKTGSPWIKETSAKILGSSTRTTEGSSGTYNRPQRQTGCQLSCWVMSLSSWI